MQFNKLVYTNVSQKVSYLKVFIAMDLQFVSHTLCLKGSGKFWINIHNYLDSAVE